MDEHTVYLQIIVTLVSLSRSVALTDEVPHHLKTISRTLSGDVFIYYNSAKVWICGGYDNYTSSTILVSEGRCITNEELFNGNKNLISNVINYCTVKINLQTVALQSLQDKKLLFIGSL